MKLFSATDVFLCLGRRGSGKSYLARRIQGAYPRKVIFDTLGEYGARDGVLCHSFAEFGRALLRIESEGQRTFTLIYQFDVERESHTSEFDQALRVLWHRGDVLVCVEEVQYFATAHSMPMWLRNCLLTGRHRHLGLVFTTQRPGECHKTIVSQANHVFCGSLHEKNDLDYVKSVLGDKAQELIHLPERRFIYFRPGRGVSLIRNDLKPL